MGDKPTRAGEMAARVSKAQQRERTHWAECWRSHHACAVARVERQAERIAELERENANLRASVGGDPAAWEREVDARRKVTTAHLTPAQWRRMEAAGWEPGEMAVAEWLVRQAERAARLERIIAVETGREAVEGWQCVTLHFFGCDIGTRELEAERRETGWRWRVLDDERTLARGEAPTLLEAIEAAEEAHAARVAEQGGGDA